MFLKFDPKAPRPKKRKSMAMFLYADAANKLKAIGGKLRSKRMLIDIDKITHDAKIQRGQGFAHMAEIYDHFVGAMLDDPVVFPLKKPKGEFSTIDGGHRLPVLKAQGVKKVWCRVIYGLDFEGGAAAFIVENMGRKAPTSMEQFHVGVRAGNDKAITVKKILHEFNCSVPRASSKSGDHAHSPLALMEILTKEGEGALREVISLLTEIWPATEPKRLSLGMLKGISELLNHRPPKARPIDRARFIRVMREIPMSQVISSAAFKRGQGGCNLGESFCYAMEEFYFKRMRNHNKEK